MIGIVKSKDKRNFYLSQLINKPHIYSENENDFLGIDILILPVLGIDNDGYCKNTNILLIDILKLNPNIKTIITGVASNILKEICKSRNIVLHVLLEKKEIINENAKLTSEGLLRLIGNQIDYSLGDLNVLILGFGYCAQALIHDLKNYPTRIDVFARDYHDQKSIFIQNLGLCENLEDLSRYDLIINTIPFQAMKEKELSSIRKDALVFDIASYPYGFDLDKAKELKIDIQIVPGIPGIILPKSAAKVLYQEVEKIIV